MTHFLAAVRFITIVPLGRAVRFDPQRLAAWFPLVGLLIGLMLAGMDHFVRMIWSGPATALVDVILLVLVSGALHLDGLADTADGLYGHHDRRKALAIMKDSRIGPMGVIAILTCLALKWAGIAGLQADRALILILVPAYARTTILIGMRSLPYARSEGGTGAPFFEQTLPWTAFWTLPAVFGLSLLLGWRALLLNLAFILMVGVILVFYRRRINGITGDMLGGMIEITETGLFFVLSGGILL